MVYAFGMLQYISEMLTFDNGLVFFQVLLCAVTWLKIERILYLFHASVQPDWLVN